jgi:hypothetical protein
VEAAQHQDSARGLLRADCARVCARWIACCAGNFFGLGVIRYRNAPVRHVALACNMQHVRSSMIGTDRVRLPGPGTHGSPGQAHAKSAEESRARTPC